VTFLVVDATMHEQTGCLGSCFVGERNSYRNALVWDCKTNLCESLRNPQSESEEPEAFVVLL
jgi:hypothetical protein